MKETSHDGDGANRVDSGGSGPASPRNNGRDPSLHRGTTSVYYEKPTGYGPLHVTIIYDSRGPYRVFCNIPPMGTEISGLTAVMGILLSKYLEIGGDPVRILKHLNSIKGDRPHGFGPARVDSIAHALAECLKDHLIQTGKLRNGHGPGGHTLAPEPRTREEKTASLGSGTRGAVTLGSVTHPADGGAVKSGDADRRERSRPAVGGVDIGSPAHGSTADPFCPSCYSRNVSFVGGCKEPTCADCGFSNCG